MSYSEMVRNYKKINMIEALNLITGIILVEWKKLNSLNHDTEY